MAIKHNDLDWFLTIIIIIIIILELTWYTTYVHFIVLREKYSFLQHT